MIKSAGTKSAGTNGAGDPPCIALPAVARPFVTTLAALRTLNQHMAALKVAPEGKGWLSLAQLLDEPGEPLRAALARVDAHFKTTNRRVGASLFFGDVAYALMALATGGYLAARRVPQLTTASVWLNFGARGDVEGLALSDYRFAALADDPAALHADCVVLPSPDALQDFLIARAHACLEPLIAAMRAHTPLGVPAMWALAADYTASAATFVGRSLQQADAALELARRLAAKPSRLRRKRDFIHIEACGQHYDLVDRVSCCLYYQVEDGRYCASCPHRPQPERVAMIQQWLTESAAAPQNAS